MTEEMGRTAQKGEVVTFPPIKEDMVMGVLQVHIEGTGIAPTMAMDPNQTQDWNEGEVLTMTEQKAQPMRDTKGE